MAAFIGDLIVKLALTLGMIAISAAGFFAVRIGNELLNTEPQNNYSNQYISPSPTTTQTPKTSPKATREANTTPKIDCTGPDKVVFKTTQKECDNFNAAWGNINKDSQAATKIISTQPKNYFCKITDLGNKLYTSNKEECNTLINDISNSQIKQNNFNLCMNSKNQDYDNCILACKSTTNSDYNVCAWAYTGSTAAIEQNSDLYNECLSQANKEYGTCSKVCSDNHAEAIKSCNGNY